MNRNMKVITIIVCILLSQASASFFDDFNGAISSVEDSFGKLFSDVVSDVRTTLGCTILAVKKVLALGGDFHESSDYDERCGGQSRTDDSSVQDTLDSYSATPPIITTSVRHSDHSEISLSDRISAEVDESVGKVKDKVLDIIENHDTPNKIEQVKKRLKNSTDRLSEIGALLHKELDNLTEDVKIVLSRVEIDYIHPTLDNLWKDVKILHDIELKETNPKDAAEIKHILNEILQVLSPTNASDDSLVTDPETCDSDKLFSLIQDQFEKMKENNKPDDIETVMSSLDMVDGNNTLQKEIDLMKTTRELPLTFQDVEKKIMNETKNELSVASSAVKDSTPDNGKKSVGINLLSVSTDKTTSDEFADLPEDYSFFVIPKDSQSRKAAAMEAQNLIKQSEKTEKLLSSLFEESETQGTSLFDNPELFVF